MPENWSYEALRASVREYLDALHQQRRGRTIVKAEIYRSLAEEIGRSPKSCEFRMRNISHVLELQGRRWIHGLPPSRHTGTNVVAHIERALAELEGQNPPESAAFDSSVSDARRSHTTDSPPQGNRKPEIRQQTVSEFHRDPRVVAWVLDQAEGMCECCGQGAPFKKADGTPFLEVHHIVRLTDLGSDTVDNAVAVCPNCHRELHYGEARDQLVVRLREKIGRLQ